MRALLFSLLLATTAHAQNTATATIYATATLVGSTTIEEEDGFFRWTSNDPYALAPVIIVTRGTDEVQVELAQGVWTDARTEGLALLDAIQDERRAKERLAVRERRKKAR